MYGKGEFLGVQSGVWTEFAEIMVGLVSMLVGAWAKLCARKK